jgi:hypothetical protein
MTEMDQGDQIQRYLTGQMAPEERLRFEDELKSNKDLKSEVEELSNLFLGILIDDKISANHLNPEQIFQYAEEVNKIEKSLRGEIEDHLAKCPDCREEVELCQETLRASQAEAFGIKESLLKRIYNYLFGLQLILRPAYAVAILILLAIPSYFAVNRYITSPAGIAEFRIADSGVRGIKEENIIKLDNKNNVVKLVFRVPVISDRLYSFELYDSSNNLKLSSPFNKAEDLFAFEIPASYLKPGRYNLIVREYGPDLGQQEQFQFPINIVQSE